MPKTAKKTTKTTSSAQNLSIAQQIAELEELMQKIESGELDINASISALKEATDKANALKAELKSVQLSVNEISIDSSDEE